MTQKNNGFSLIELLISCLLSTSIIIGIINFMLITRQHYGRVQVLNNFTNNAIFATATLKKYLKLAGFHVIQSTLDKNKNDLIKIIFFGNAYDLLQDCANRKVLAGKKSVNTFFIDAQGLACRAEDETTQRIQHLVPGVEMLRLLYEQQSPDGSWQQLNVQDPRLNLAWVRQVQVALVLHSADDFLPKPTAFECRFWQHHYRANRDRKLRLCWVFTVKLDHHFGVTPHEYKVI